MPIFFREKLMPQRDTALQSCRGTFATQKYRGEKSLFGGEYSEILDLVRQEADEARRVILATNCQS